MNRLKTASVVLPLLFVGVYLVSAQDTTNQYNIQVVHVFPGKVESKSGWKNIETISNQNLDEFALYQEFNAINSVFFELEEVSIEQVIENRRAEEFGSDDDADPVAEETDEAQTASTTATTTEEVVLPVATSTDEASTPDIIFDVLPTTEDDLDTEETTEPDVSQTTTTESVASGTTAFKRVTNNLSLVFASVVDLLPFANTSTTTEVTDDAHDEQTVEVVEEEVTETPVPVVAAATTSETVVEDEVAETEATTTPEVFEDIEVVNESVVATTTASDAVPATATTTEEVVLPSATSTDEEVATVEDDVESATTTVPIIEDECGDECADYRLHFADFGLPIFDDGAELDGLQLRMSMAAKMKDTRDTSQWLTSRYSLDGGQTWSNGGEILISGEVSNSTNGGYFVLALPEITDPAVLDALEVELIYNDDPRGLEGLYIDSVWLELFTVSAPDIEDTSITDLLSDDGYDHLPLSGDVLAMPDGEVITFDHTDNNDNETLIIKSDRTNYNGLSRATAYVSVTNTSNSSDDFVLQTYFPNGRGTVESVEVWNQNKPRNVVIPEYRPFVYHCEAGWDLVDGDVPASLEELSQQLSPESILANEANENEVNENVEEPITVPDEDVVVEDAASSTPVATTTPTTDVATTTEVSESTGTTTEEVLEVATEAPLLQAVVDELIASSSLATSTGEEAVMQRYACRNTSIVRTCDSITGDNTECRLENVKVREHGMTKYGGGWDIAEIEPGERPDDRGLLRKVGDFLGFGAQTKDVPGQFVLDSHSEDRFSIRPGETRYFKVEVSFPPFTNGEFWFEAIGRSEYGLLDPFWSSDWQYRIPIQIDNTQGTEAMTEQQIFFELDSSLSDFWSNVQEDGSDIRFVQEIVKNNLYPEDGPVFSNNYNPSWTGRITLTVPASSVGSDLTDFPVHVDLSTLGADFWSQVQSDGRDIRVTRSNGATEVPVDLVWIDDTSETGQMYFKAPLLSASQSTDFHIYYGNQSATARAASDTYGSENVWTNGYAAVYHFQNEGQAGRDNVGEYTDSTANGFDAEDDTLAASTTGFLGDGVEFLLSNSVVGNDSADHINIPYQVADQQPEMTYSVWYFSTTSSGIDHTLLSGMRSTTTGDINDQDNEWIAWLPSDTQMQQYENNNAMAAQSIPNVSTNGWAQYVFTRSVANNEMLYYVDGVGVGTTSEANVVDTVDVSPNGLIIGMEQDDWQIENTNQADDALDGFIDEVRFARQIRSHDWVVAEYETQANPTSFYSTSTSGITADPGSDAWYSTSWNGRQLFTISPDNVQADQTDFPVYLDLSILDSAFFSGVASDGRDIRITTKAGAELPIEIVYIDTGGNAGEVHFKTNLSSSINNEFYIYYDNPDAIAYADSDTFGAHNVWTNNYIAVYHFDGAVSGTGNADAYIDSTSNEYHGDDENSSDDSTGQVGRGIEFGDGVGDHIDLPDEVLDGVTDITVEGWYNPLPSSSTTDRMLLSAANAAEADEFMLWLDVDGSGPDEFVFEHSNGAEVWDFDFGGTWGTGTWEHFMVTGEDAPDEVNFYRNGISDGENPDPQAIDALSVDNGGFVIGQNQSTVGSFTTANQFIGQLDEFRFSSVVRDGSWANTSYLNQSDPASFFSTSSAEVLQEVEFVELDFWVQHFSSTTEEADIWVQVASVPAGETATIWLYYGASGVTSASDPYEPFTYSEPQELYYVVDGSGVTEVSVQSLVDNNQVSFDGAGTTTLNRGEQATTTTLSATTLIRASGPVSGTLTGPSTDSSDTIAPISFASTTFALPTARANNSVYVYSPFASSSVQSYTGSSGTADTSISVATSAAATITASNPAGTQGADGDGIMVESSEPILVMHRSDTPGDGYVAYPPTFRDIYGINSQNVHLSATGTTNVDVYCSNGLSATGITVDRGDHEDDGTCVGGTISQGLGHAVRYTNSSAEPIAAIQQADADGNESTAFWPEMEFGVRYAMTNDAAYVSIACSPRFGEVDLEIQDSTGATIESGTCTPGTTDPGKAFFGSGASGAQLSYTAGHQIVATNDVPFYAYYEDVEGESNGDEKNMLGQVQGRKFGATDVSFEFGPQEIANDADYTQHSFMWFENANDQTPTSTWPIGDTNVSEGDSITGAGALQDGDVIRLRMNIQANTATGTVNSAAFKLEYGTALADQCSTITEANWFEVGQQGSTTAAFSGYDLAGIQDGSVLASTTLTDSNVFGTYEERNLSNLIKNEIGVGDYAEFDWVLEATNVDVNTNYCFRMVRDGGVAFDAYTLYPQLETVGPPNTPTLIIFFDNERTTTTIPILEFTATDIAGDDINYQVQVDEDFDFSSPDIDRNSNDNFLQFENVNDNSDKAPFASGNQIRFSAATTLATGTTYWWRVRADDPNGSATTSDWSAPFSFTVEETLPVTEWYQTTGHQFSTNELSGLSTSTGAVSLSSSPGTMTGTAIDFDDAVYGNAWGSVSWSDTETSGTTTIQVQYNNNGTWTLVPDSLIPGNSVGTSTSPINILPLDTDAYNELRLIANFEGTTLSLEEWSVTWGLRVETPVLGDPFDNQAVPSTLPTFDFISSDPQGDDLEYELSISTDYNFLVSSSTFNSSTSAGFSNASNGADTNPFNSGDTINYTAQSALTDGTTYWWRVRAKDPNGGNSWSPWSDPDAFTASTTVSVSTWFQTTEDQFLQGVLDGTVASTSDSVEVSDQIGEYGTVSLTNNDWQTVNTQISYNNMVVVASAEYDGSSFSNGRTARVRNKTNNSFQIKVDDYTNGFTGSTDVDYVVMEAGTWTLDEGGTGVQVIAGTAEDVTAVQARPFQNNIGTLIDYSSTPFSGAPVGFATVSSNNDTDWVGTHIDGDGADHDVEITANQMQVAMNTSYQGVTTHAAEDIDYLVIGVADGTINGGDFEAFNSSDNVDDVQNQGGHTQSFQTGFGSTPAVTVVHNNGEDGGDGAFALKDTSGTSNASQIFLSMMEIGAGADQHTQEIVSIIAFEDSSGILTRLDSGDLSGTIAGEDVLFTDGTGPKFDNFSWYDTTPGVSDILYQMQYQVSEGVYALIPDTDIPGNSSGTTTSPIDLTSVDINVYPIIRPYATLSCSGGDCPTLDEWQVEWSEGVSMSGTLSEYDRTTAVTSGSVVAAVNSGATTSPVAVAGDGTWTIPNITAFDGDIITVWVTSPTTDADRAVAAFVYDGLGDITGVELYEQHLSISADENGTTTNALLGLKDNSDDADIFYSVDGSNNLDLCASGSCDHVNLYVGPGNVFIPSTSTPVTIDAHDFVNDGFIELDNNTFNLTGSYDNNATSTTDTSTINFTATSTSETITSTESPLDFHTLSFGAGAGTATFTISAPLDLSGSLTVASGTLARDGYDITVEGNITTGSGGVWSGTGTTTFDGAGVKTWTDNNPTSQNIGNVIIDGASTFVNVSGDVTAYDITIGSNDTLSSGTNNIFVAGDWTNNGAFIPGNGTVHFINDNRTYPPLTPGSADWYADTNFTNRIPIIVQNSEVPGAVTNFPTYVDLSTLGADFWSSVQSDGDDIRITTSDGQTELAYELVEINASAETGELHFLADSISASATTTFFIYFNNATATAYAPDATYGSEAVWVDYDAVWHFNDDPSVVGNVVYDASGNDKNLIVLGEGLATTTGILGTALNSSGTVGYLQDSDFDWIAGDRMTTSGWYFMDALDNETLWEWGTGDNPNDIEFRPWYNTTNGLFYFGRNDGTAQYAINPRTPSIWRHFMTVGATSTSQNNVVFEDAVQVDSFAQTDANPSHLDGIRVAGNSGSGLNGFIDELRISQVERNSDWAEAEYNNQFTPTSFYATSSVETYVPDSVTDEATHNITAGGSAFYNLTFDDATTSPAFIDPSVVVDGDFTIATGTVALPTGKLTVGGSFLNSGFFMHNNSEIEFNGSGPETITLGGTQFLNLLYDVTFDGSATWTITDTNATTSNDMIISDGTVIFPSGSLAIGGRLGVSGSGDFDANNGLVHFISANNELISTNGASFNDVIFGLQDSNAGWYGSDWGHRTAITVGSTSIDSTLVDFPVFVDLSDLGATFWNNVSSDGSELRMTRSDGLTEVPLDVVEINVGAQTGEIHFLANALNTTADTTFYLYHNNPDATMPASDSTYGSEAVWVGYEAVYHFNEDPTTGVTDETGNGFDLSPLVGTPATSTGQLGTALDLSADGIMLGDADWTWTSGEDLVSSGWYFMDSIDAGGLWQWGSSCATDDCMAYLPWYDSVDRGYHRFGETGGNDFRFTRTPSVWRHFTTIGRATSGQDVEIYEDTVLRDIYAQTGSGADPSLTGLQVGRYQTGNYLAAIIDELRFATSTPTKVRIDAEYRNQSAPSSFYTTNSETYLDVVASFTLNEGTTDVDGDVTVQYANLVAPTNNFTIGGSALNTNGSYDPNNATTTFDSNDGIETVNFGDVDFYNLVFSGAGGGWSISTTTVTENVTLGTGDDFTLQPGTTLTVGGIFTNSFNAASTTWTDTTLVLTGGDYTVTDRLDSGDDYATVQVSNDSDIVIWNSTISTSTISGTSSLYMPDYAGTDGELRIFGDYERLSGAEYWSYATDFDGTDISGTPRAASILLDGNARVYLGSGTTLNMIGTPAASTTISSLFGVYELTLDAATINANNFELQDADPNGLYLAGGTTVTNLTDATFTVQPGRTGLTADDSTINAQPSSEFSGLNFASTSPTSFYGAGWSSQLVLTIQSSQIDNTLTNFPVYVDLSTLGPAFWSSVTSDGRDIRITLPDGTELPYDLVEINTGLQTGELHFLAPSLSSFEDTTFYIHYNNPDAVAYASDDPYGSEAVWVGYDAVYHFSEDPTTIGNQMIDSTNNDRNLFVTNAALATTTGQLGTALDMDGLSGYLVNTGFSWPAGAPLAVSGWYFMDAADPGDDSLWRWGTTGTFDNPNDIRFRPWETQTGSTRGLYFFGRDDGTADYVISPRVGSVWHHFMTLGATSTSENNYVYEDAVQVGSWPQTDANPSNNDGFAVGLEAVGSYIDAVVDELRIASTTFSTTWINVEYLNHSTATDLYATSTAESMVYNVTASGTPAAFWRFVNGTGNIYGEDYDNDDGDPGSIQWDNSNFSITIAGTVYSDDGVTPMGAPVCNGSTEVVTVVIDGTDTYQAACDSFTGEYAIDGIVYVGEPKIVAYVESAASSPTTTVQLYAQATTTGTTGGNQITISRPAVINNSVLVAVIGKDDDAGATIAAPAGWTAIDNSETAGDDHEVGMWYRIVSDAGTEPATYDFTTTDNGEGFTSWVGTLINVDLGAVLDVGGTWNLYADTPQPEATNITTVTDGALAISAFYVANETETVSPLGGWRTLIDDVAHSDGDVLSVSSKSIETAGAIGTTSLYAVNAASDSHAIQVAFRPSSTPVVSGSVTAAVVSQTPLGAAGSPYETIEQRDQTAGNGTVASGADVDVLMPQVENGDLVVIAIGKDDNFDLSTPSGWTLADELLTTSGNDAYLGVWYRYISNAAGEPVSYAFTSNDGDTEAYAYWAASFDGVDQNTPFDVNPVVDQILDDTTPPAQSVTTVTPGARVNAIWFIDNDTTIFTPGGSWETLIQDNDNGGWNLNVAAQTFTSTGATGDANASGLGGGDDTVSVQVALRPAAVSVADNISDFDLYQDRVIVRHEDIAALTIADMDRFDNDDDSDIPFTAATTSTDTLTVLPGSGLFVWDNTTFAPDGIIDLQGGGNTAADGSFRIGANATYTASSTFPLTVGGSFYVNNGGTFTVASSTVTFSATNTGQLIGADASSTVTFADIVFQGTGGNWAVQTPIISQSGIQVASGTVSGVSDITVLYNSFYGDGLVNMTGGTVLMSRTNTLGGANSWTFNDLTLGNGAVTGITTPGSNATTTVSGTLTIDTAHFLDAGSSVWNLTGNGTVFVESGTFQEDTSTVRYAGNATIPQTTHYNLRAEADTGSITVTAPNTGLSILNDLTIGETGTATLDIDANDPTVSVGGAVYIAPLGTLEASNVSTFQAFGAWDNDGVFTANGGLVTFNSTATTTVAAGNSDFYQVNVIGDGEHTFTEHATATDNFTIDSFARFVLAPNQQLSVGGVFTNNRGDIHTTWTDSTLYLYGGQSYDVSSKSIADDYATVTVATLTHPRFWGSSFADVITAATSSVYSRNHNASSGDLYIFGDYVNDTYNDYWSYEVDFDGANIGDRQVFVQIEDNGSVTYTGGSLDVSGSTTATTTIAAQGSGPYDFTVTGTASSSFTYYSFRDLGFDGLVFTGTPTVEDLSYGDFLVTQNGASAITVGGPVISANPAQNYDDNSFATTTGIDAFNVTATGTSASAWKFRGHYGGLDGENEDNDAGGNPGYVIWDDSLAIYNVDGFVYESDGSTVSNVCDGSSNVITLVIDGVVDSSVSCAVGTGAYSFPGISPNFDDAVMVYINNGGSEEGIAITADIFTSLSDMNVYEDHVILRHESSDTLTIADIDTYDSADDGDVPYTATTGSPDTWTVDPDIKVLVWNDKTFEPDGDVTTGGGAGDAFDGTIELQDDAVLLLATGEDHTFGGNLEMGTGSTFTPGQSTVSFSSSGTGRTIDTNESGFYNLTMSGTGDFVFQDTNLVVGHDLSFTNASATLPAATTTISGSLTTTGGNWNANGGIIEFDSAGAGEVVTANGSEFNELIFTGSGSWSMNDTNATTTGSIVIESGAVTLPSGVLAVGAGFSNTGGSFTNNSGEVKMTSGSGSQTIETNGSTLGSLRIAGAANFTMADLNAALSGSLFIDAGALELASGTLSIGGSFDAVGGTFDNASGTVLFNSTGGVETIDPGTSSFYNINFGSGSGDWTITANATATNNVALTSASSFTLNPNITLHVDGVFTNSVGGGATTWTDSILRLDSGTDYSINTKSAGGDVYGTLIIGENMNTRMWESSAATTTLASTTNSSLFSQDHAATDGYGYIYGNFYIATTTEYWSYATDFDGTALGGSPRAVNIFVVSAASSSITFGGNATLNMIGSAAGTTTIQALGTDQYSFDVSGGTFNAQYYALRDMDINGLEFSGTPTISNLDYGDYEQALNSASLITLASTTLDNNASLTIEGNRFATGGFTGGVNVNLDATTTNSWTYSAHYGGLDGEAFDVDGSDECSSIRWDDSQCLLTEQTHYRWRNDDGFEGAPDSTWYDTNWDKRKRIRVVNSDDASYTNVAVKVPVTYDSDMQTNFDDLRFTDSDGTTIISHWTERFSTGVSADVWVQIPSMATSSATEVFMYYDNVTASSTSSSTEVFDLAEDFETSVLSTDYSGSTGSYTIGSSFAYGGSNGLDASGNEGTNLTPGVARFDLTTQQGQIIRYMQYIDTSAGSSDEVCTMFGVQSPVTDHNNYAVCLEQFGTDRMVLAEDVESTDTYPVMSPPTIHGTTNVTYSTGWYEVQIDWQTDGDMFVTLYDSTGTAVATTSGNDTTYSSGGIGFTSWGQNGGWDSYVAWPRTDTKPSVYVGAEQTDGGATWKAAQDTPTGGYAIGETARLRISIENSGLDIENQNFRLESAVKGGAPSCEAVSGGSFAAVPTAASCSGSDEICMTTSASTTDGDATTDHLVVTGGDFIAGEIVANNSNETSNIDIDQNQYTEIEYAINLTANAVNDAYCFRVTNGGATLDSYALLPELTLAFNPIISQASLNSGSDIVLSVGTSTTILATSSVTDLNGYTDLNSATATIYRSGVGESCTADNNNCYIATTTNMCQFTDCSGNSCTLSCSADIVFHADPTDVGTFAGETWRAFFEVSDDGGATTSAQAPSVDLLTLRALEVDNEIGYGTVSLDSDTGTFNPTTTITNLGNESIDVDVSGTDMTDGGVSVIDATQQQYATSSFDYSACAFCSTLTNLGSTLEVDLDKPTTTSPLLTDEIFWGIYIPFGTAGNPHQGTNTFTAVAD